MKVGDLIRDKEDGDLYLIIHETEDAYYTIVHVGSNETMDAWAIDVLLDGFEVIYESR